MLKLSSATDHKKKTHIEFGSLLELKIYIYIGETFRHDADITTDKCLFNSVNSTKFAKFLGLDIKKFYLNTHMGEYE